MPAGDHAYKLTAECASERVLKIIIIVIIYLSKV